MLNSSTISMLSFVDSSQLSITKQTLMLTTHNKLVKCREFTSYNDRLDLIIKYVFDLLICPCI